MSKIFCWKSLPVVLAGLAVATLPMYSQGIPVEGPAATTALVAVQSKKGVPLYPSLLKLQVGKETVPLLSVTPVAKLPVQIAILIDDGLRFSISNRLSDISDFINSLPQGTEILLGYMQNGIIRGMHTFSTNRQAVVAQMRIPMSIAGVDGSPYFCMQNLVQNWPSNQPAARFVLLITNGIDPYNGSYSIMNQDSPYVDAAQRAAERAGVAVYSIYWGQDYPHRARGSFSGQSYLAQVGEATGAESYNIGIITPPSLTPYLNQFGDAIANSYMIRFNLNSARVKPDTLVHIKLTTSQHGAKLHAPHNVHPGVDLW